MKNRRFCSSQAFIFQSKFHQNFKLFPTLFPGRFFSDFWQTFCQSKIPLKSDSSKTHPKPQKSDPWSPKRRFCAHFWDKFWHGFSWNSWFLHNMLKPQKHYKTAIKTMIWGLQASLFPIKIPSKFQAFSNTPSWTSFFQRLMLPGAKMLDFGTPWRPAWPQNDAQNRPNT